MLLACARLTDAIYEGLDVGLDVRAVAAQGLGETVLLWDEGELAGFAVCHCGAGSGTCYVKFGAVRPSPVAERDFDRLLDACEALARERGLARLSAGVNTARIEAYRRMLERAAPISRAWRCTRPASRATTGRASICWTTGAE